MGSATDTVTIFILATISICVGVGIFAYTIFGRRTRPSRPAADIRKPERQPPISPQQQIEELRARIEQLRASGRKIIAQREEWRGRALSAEAKLAEAATKGDSEHGADRYAALKRYLAKQFHPDNAPGPGIEKMVRSEIFKEIWSEIDRLDHQS
jgi:hypothetical protein